MTLEANVLGPESVRSTPLGYEIDVHLAWYRSLPLSCVENISIRIADKAIPQDDIRISYNDKQLTVEELADLVDDWWFVQDPLTIQVNDNSPLSKGSRTSLQVTLDTRIPYIIIGPETALVKRTEAMTEVTVK
ncbi:hypothetical protein FV139_14130 [Parahaliea maris]|uniref:C-deglycosylation enzyme beta subunit n=1 Tax=Parahaliea maris TaxID=2716870 RepID=A0A5C8ZXD3_9GAMM|nr:DUF6379 domain-containing protein [Parahaliea maris]TXS91871.1 hypothetical protein FV139_14130 [Parahaliea maris]